MGHDGRPDGPAQPGHHSQDDAECGQRYQIAQLAMKHDKVHAEHGKSWENTPALLKGPKNISAEENLLTNCRHNGNLQQPEKQNAVWSEEVLNHYRLGEL